jgi:RimJ/RimL family protein N-acetyltransferase
MILQVGTPGLLTDQWHQAIQKAHTGTFGFALNKNIAEYWWFADIRNNCLAGLAGAKHAYKGAILLGPCMVFDHYKGRGIQREFIAYREDFALNLGYREMVAYTEADNLASANNLIRMGFLLTKLWDDQLIMPPAYLYWRKML